MEQFQQVVAVVLFSTESIVYIIISKFPFKCQILKDKQDIKMIFTEDEALKHG